MHNLARPLKVVAFNGSPHKKGNTYKLVQKMFEVFHTKGIKTELITIGNKPISGCRDCGTCSKKKFECVIKKDIINSSIKKILNADGVILASPTHFAGPSGAMKCFIDRVGYVNHASRDKDYNGFLYRKVCSSIAVHRRGGATNAHSQMNYLWSISGSIVPGSNYWNFGVGHRGVDVITDEEGLANMENLAHQMSDLMIMIKEDKLKKENK
ncbi:nad(p)h-dependent fmn-containing oxidoreductase ywqn-related [Anaeramoeba flamelloides]|uniref:Nad(P)h-dependent fmn-containing oxidoreductase ywqn-related n=1 Tax=Anaeramoeba flamelloides TaxID=1746091 RepID=A0ABQ8Y4W3_9EUKA|nr:nad(p)h-dependent fmn-containing oxidoreductase ywqn-related [Anaeramoeba flamelloides]